MSLLHLGCGRKGPELKKQFGDVILLDADAANKPDLVCCLGRDLIALPDNSVDGAVAIHVLEHIGKQGETSEWFFFWEELYRVLKDGARLEFVSPLWNSVWAWSDPTHTRALSPESFIFFAQDSYRIPDSPISPYRIRCNFVPLNFTHHKDTGSFSGILVATKPLDPWWEDTTGRKVVAASGAAFEESRIIIPTLTQR